MIEVTRGHWFKATVGLILAALLSAIFAGKAADYRELARYGVHTTGTVESIVTSERRAKSGRHYVVYEHVLVYDGKHNTFALHEIHPIGSSLPVLYASNNPSNAKVTNARNSAIAIAVSDNGVLPTVGMLFVPLFLFGMACVHLRKALRGN